MYLNLPNNKYQLFKEFSIKILTFKYILLWTVVALCSVVTGFAQETTKVDIRSGYLEIRPELPDAAIYTRESNAQVYIVHEGSKYGVTKLLVL